MVQKPAPKSSLAEQELTRLDEQFKTFDENVKELTLDRMNCAPKEECEPQTKLSTQEIDKSRDIYLKPHRIIGCQDKFNERYREAYNFDKEYVHFQAENKEIIGEDLDVWTRPYGGLPAEWWKVPTNKPVWGPRYLAEQIKRKYYHRLTMDNTSSTGSDGRGQYYGTIAVDRQIQRLDAHPISSKRSVFMGSKNF